jgi:deazaflavin-dependent oxidoreductase (nitroreductase family)
VSLLLRLAAAAQRGLYRRTNGRIGARMGGQAFALITTTGRKTGLPRTVIVCVFEDGDARVVVASASGSPTHPAWLTNLQANPEVTVQVGANVYPARARVTAGDERARLWQLVTAKLPAYVKHQVKAGEREIPVVRLEARS